MDLEVETMKDLCVIGIETSGLDVVQDEILEIGIVKIDKGRNISGRFSSLVWPGAGAFSRPVAEKALEVQNRNEKDFICAPLPEEIAKVALAFIGDWKHTQLASYNVRFDRGFLRRKAWERIGNGYPWSVCIMQLCSHIMGRAGSPQCSWSDFHRPYSWPQLTDTAQIFGVQFDPTHGHRALFNAELAARIYLRALNYTSPEDGPE